MSWRDVIKLLTELGYSQPRHYKICLNKDHSVLLNSKETACEVCSKPRQDCSDYYVLGLGFEDWFCTEERCEQLMSHWREKDDWLHGAASNVRLSEVWHGERFQELSYFWDCMITTLMPQKCKFCNAVIPSSIIIEKTNSGEPEQITLHCPVCKSDCTLVTEYMQGDPRNQAIIIHEDGWSSHSTSAKHSVAAITITNACMNKLDRSYNKNARVYSFIPTDQLPKGCPHKFDAFFRPLLHEIEELYISGSEVFFKSAVAGHSPANDTAVLRLVPLLFTADLRAHAEIGLYSAGGRKGCRRCELIGSYVRESNHYYFDGFHARYHDPSPLRSVEVTRPRCREVDNACTQAQRKRLTREYGVTGESILYRLYDLCGFDPIKDMVIDAMHAVSLNLLRSEMEKHLLAELGDNSSVIATDRDPRSGGLLSRADLAKTLTNVTWPAEYKDGRVPSICPSEPSGPHKLGFWKCEEFMKLAAVAPYVLHSIIPKRAYDCVVLLTRIHELIYSKRLRVDGWTQEHTILLRSLLWKHAILLESLYGTKACTENVECSSHMTEDIKRHSTLDNYWCFVYERLVKYYKGQTSNMKQLCKTFADRACQLRFVETYLETRSPANRDLEEVSTDLSSASFLEAKTEKQAMAMKDEIARKYESLSERIKTHYASGILLGCSKLFMLSARQISDVSYWIRKEMPSVNQTELSDLGYSYPRLLKTNENDQATTFRVGEHVILIDDDNDDREWVLRITKIFVCGPVTVSNKYYSFLDGDYFVAKSCRGEIMYDSWTDQPMMIPREFQRLRVQPLKNLQRKVAMYPMPQNATNPGYFLTIDFDGLPNMDTCSIPYYPKVGDVIKIPSHVIVVEAVNSTTSTGKGNKLKSVRGQSGKWKKSGTEVNFSLLSVDKKLDYVENIGVYSLF